MANIAQADLRKRTIEVDREKLIETLESNRKKHIEEYEAAKAGYKEAYLSKIEQGVKDARKALDESYQKRIKEISELSDEDIDKQDDYIRLFDGISMTLKVPRSFAKEYDAAIEIAKWDVKKTLELSYAEFTCFVLDQWDWKSDFVATSKMYSKAI